MWPRVRDGKEDLSKQSTEGRGRHFDSGHEVLVNRVSRVQDCLTTEPLFSLQNGNRCLRPASCPGNHIFKRCLVFEGLVLTPQSMRLHKENRAVQKQEDPGATSKTALCLLILSAGLSFLSL